jgi:hypothetical protein
LRRSKPDTAVPDFHLRDSRAAGRAGRRFHDQGQLLVSRVARHPARLRPIAASKSKRAPTKAARCNSAAAWNYSPYGASSCVDPNTLHSQHNGLTSRPTVYLVVLN